MHIRIAWYTVFELTVSNRYYRIVIALRVPYLTRAREYSE